MPLRVLDGNQSATTLSSVVTGGEHIVAHTVVSLGSTAISNITSAVSGSTVCVGNLGLLQSTVGTEGVSAAGNFIKIGGHAGTATTGNIVHVSSVGAMRVDGSSFTQPISGSVTISNFPATQTIAGTVTANLAEEPFRPNPLGNYVWGIPVGYNVGEDSVGVVNFYDMDINNGPLPVKNGSDGNNPIPLAISGTVTVGNSVTIGSLPTLTPQLPRVTFIDGSGSVTTANTAITVFASSSTRSYLLVQVTTGSAFVNVGATATTVNGISLTAGQGYAWETTIPQGAVSLISTTTSSRYVAKEA